MARSPSKVGPSMVEMLNWCESCWKWQLGCTYRERWCNVLGALREVVSPQEKF